MNSARFANELPKFENDETAILALSVGASPTHKIWSAGAEDTPSRCSPTSGRTVRSRSSTASPTRKLGFANRGTFVIDKEGVIQRFAEMNGPGEARDQGAWGGKALATLRVLMRITGGGSRRMLVFFFRACSSVVELWFYTPAVREAQPPAARHHGTEELVLGADLDSLQELVATKFAFRVGPRVAGHERVFGRFDQR